MLVTDEAAQGGSKVAVRFVKSLVDLKAKYDRLASEGFNDHRLFLQAVNSVRYPLHGHAVDKLCFRHLCRSSTSTSDRLNSSQCSSTIV